MEHRLLKYGLNQHGTLVHVDSVPNGLECGCRCPHCKTALEAKNGGQILQHHFAHQNNESCGGGPMTALHILVQQILKERKRMLLPGFRKSYRANPKKVEFDRVDAGDVEDKTNNRSEYNDRVLIPDCIGYMTDKHGEEHKLWIEVFVTHKVSYEKERLIRERGIACVEIDCSGMKDDYTEESIIHRLEIDSEHKRWVCNPRYEKEDQQARERIHKWEEHKREERRLVDKAQEHVRKYLHGEEIMNNLAQHIKLDENWIYGQALTNELADILWRRTEPTRGELANASFILDLVKEDFAVKDILDDVSQRHSLLDCMQQQKLTTQQRPLFIQMVHQLYCDEQYEFSDSHDTIWSYEEVPSLWERLKKLAQKQHLSGKDEFTLERHFITYCYEQVRMHGGEFYLLSDEKGKSIFAKGDFIKVLMELASPIFNSIVGVWSPNFAALTEVICNSRKDLAHLYIKAAESPVGRRNSYVSSKGEDKLAKLKRAVANVEQDHKYDRLFEILFAERMEE